MSKESLTLKKQELRNINDEVFFTIEINKEGGWIRGTFYGISVLEQVKSASLLYLEWVQRTPYKKILNDNSQMSGDFLDANSWLERVCFPAAAQAGLTCFAHVVSKDISNVLAITDFRKRSHGDFKVKAFDNVAEAEEWLRDCR